jgi:hypothetical protein
MPLKAPSSVEEHWPVDEVEPCLLILWFENGYKQLQ